MIKNIQSVVKVMNFHSLVRIEKARSNAEFYKEMGEGLESMFSCILNNRNLQLDKKILKPSSKKVLYIYIASDYGYCGNYNTKIASQIKQQNMVDKIIIGKRLRKLKNNHVIFSFDFAEFDERLIELSTLVYKVIKDGTYGEVSLMYNQYHSISKIELVKENIFPITVKQDLSYTEDFVFEGAEDKIIDNMFSAFIMYRLLLAKISSFASENVLRQDITSQSLKKIDDYIVIEENRERKKKKKLKNKQGKFALLKQFSAKNGE